MRGDWTNWSRSLTSTPTSIEYPTSVPELASLVERCNAEGAQLRVVGEGHSCSPLCSNDGGYLVSLQRLHDEVQVDPTTGRVAVPGGMTMRKLNDHLVDAGLALPNMGSTPDISIAGAISTGTHGTGAHVGAIDQHVVDLTIVTSTGDVVVASRDENPDLFAAVRVGLGSVGVIASVTLQCEPAFSLQVDESAITLTDALADLPGLLRAATYSRVWWFPSTDRALFWRASRVETMSPTASADRESLSVALQDWREEAQWWVTSWMSSLVAMTNRRLSARQPRSRSSQEPVHRALTLGRFIGQNVLEYGLPLEDAGRALSGLVDLARSRSLVLHAPVELRSAPTNDAWLSMAHGRATCYVGVVMYRPFGRRVAHEPTFRPIDELLAGFEGRPHWAKIHYRSTEDLARLYPKWGDFLELRRSMDANGTFLNPYLEQLFGSRARPLPHGGVRE